MSEASSLDDYRSSLNPRFLRAVRQRRELELRAAEKKIRQGELAKMRAEDEAARQLSARRVEEANKRRAEDRQSRHEAIEAERLAAFTPYERIEAIACRVFDIWPADLRVSHVRTRRLALARHFVCYWARRRTGLSYPEIGRKLGGRDHTTVLHGATVYPTKRAKMGRKLRRLV